MAQLGVSPNSCHTTGCLQGRRRTSSPYFQISRISCRPCHMLLGHSIPPAQATIRRVQPPPIMLVAALITHRSCLHHGSTAHRAYAPHWLFLPHRCHRWQRHIYHVRHRHLGCTEGRHLSPLLLTSIGSLAGSRSLIYCLLDGQGLHVRRYLGREHRPEYMYMKWYLFGARCRFVLGPTLDALGRVEVIGHWT